MTELDPPDGTTRWLAQGAKAGDLDAFNRLHEHLAKALFVWVRHRLRSRPGLEGHAEDITQATWTAAWTSLHEFDPAKGSFRAWLFGIARNRLLKAYRNAATGADDGDLTGGTVHMEQLASVPQHVTALVQRLARADDARLLCNHLDQLPREDQELVTRCGLEGATCGEVARVMNLSEQAVFKRWQRLRKRLRDEVALRALLD